MAQVERKRTLVNPARKRKRRNGKRKMSAKQLAIFGSKRHKSALKSSRKRKRRNAAKRHSPARRAAPRKRRSPRRTNRTARRHRARRRNPGGIVEVALNPAPKRRKSVARTKRRRKSTSRRRHNRRRNPAPVTHRRRRRTHARRTNRRRHARRNPSLRSGGGITNFLLGGASAAGGFIATKAATQFALGSSNTGIMGYVGNLAAAFVGGKVLGMFTKNKSIENGFMIGGALVVVARLLSDQTPLGATLQQYGLGDYEASTWLSPARYIDAAKSAAVDIPTALRPQIVTAKAAGMSGLSGTYGRGRSTY